jgi:outer membrane protein assembly factor BamB
LGTAEAEIRWKTSTKSWSNASPIRFGGLICITEEPLTLACFDADTGERTWDATNTFMDTISPTDRAGVADTIRDLERDEERLDVVQREISRLHRELRRSTEWKQVEQDYDRATAEATAIRSRLTAHKAILARNDLGIIGYATPTPTAYDGYVYALFGNGVLSKFSESGKRAWSVWLGNPIEPMRGFDTGNAASPLIVDGVLLAPYARLRGVDPSTGQILWEGPEYPHYGTPAVANVDGTSVVVTPGGELINPKDGTEVGPKISRIDFIGPVAVGEMVYAIGWVPEHSDGSSTRGTAYRLSNEVDGRISANRLWDRTLSKERLYASPLVADERIFLVYWTGEVQSLNAMNGKLLWRMNTRLSASNGSPSPTYGGGRIVVGSERGYFVTYSNDDPPKVLGEFILEEQRATPLLEDGRIYVRGFEYLYCIE